MRYLREQLDDPHATDCGRCDNCGGLALTAETSEQTVTAATATLHRPGVPFDARRMWPSAMPGLGVDVRGKIGADDVAESGRAIARFTDLGFGQRVRSVLSPEISDAAVPDDLIAAAIKVLASWGWEQRPEVVVHVGSARRPVLVADIAAQLGAIGRLPHLGQVPHAGPSSRGRSNSAMRLRDVWGSYAVPDELASELAGRPVLLVDDYTDTGWTLTVVARLLRQAGAAAVYPFVLGVAG
jgi:ATP-dependent DNA helicase RecQ